jgi:type IX secretion system PorP/SprF family membrane protein
MNGEARFRPKQFEKDAVGVSILFNSDRAGDTRYGTTQLYIGGAYIYSSFDSTVLFSMGMNVGWCQVGFDYDRMTFDNQFDGLQHNPTLASGERFDWVRYNYADINVGAAVQVRVGKSYLTYGLGLHHLSSPVITYQGNKLSKLDFKFANYFRYAVPVHPKADVIAEALVNSQGKYFEVVPHTSLKYYFSRDLNQAVLGGVCLRARDAVILRMGYHYKTMQSGIAYDINTSRFTAATSRRGAFEIFINYIIKRNPPQINKKRICPVFM